MRSSSPETDSNLGKIAQLALRISLKAGYQNLKQHFCNREADVCFLEAGFTEGKYLNDYHSVFHMATNKKSRPLNVRMDYAVLAAITIKLLEHSNFFQKLAEDLEPNQKMPETSTESNAIDPNFQFSYDEARHTSNGYHADHSETMQDQVDKIKLIYAASLVHHMQIIQCNAYGIVESDNPGVGFRIQEAVYSGLGLYPTMGLINHSCDPVLDISFNGSTAIYRAYSNVKPGGQITVDYGPIFYLQKKEERQAQLRSNYYFDCQCSPCRFNWPLWEDIQSKRPKLKCPKCDEAFSNDVPITSEVTCCNCQQTVDLLNRLRELGESHKKFAQAMEDAKSGNYKLALPVLKNHLTLMQAVIVPPWREFISCQAVIDQCYRM